MIPRKRVHPRPSATRLRIHDLHLSAEIVDFLGRAGWIASVAEDGAIEVATQRAGVPRAIGSSELDSLLKVLALMYPTLEVERVDVEPELGPA